MKTKELFEKYNDDYIKFDRVENKRSNRPDIHAFLLLDSLFPGDSDMVSSAEHDEIILHIDVEELDKVITDEVALELTRCGVRYAPEYDCLCMFV